MAINIEQIKQLREASGAGVLDCRKALEAYNGDFDRAMEYLREKGLAKAAKRADREVREGMLELYSHGNGRVGVMVEVNCGCSSPLQSFRIRTRSRQTAAGAQVYPCRKSRQFWKGTQKRPYRPGEGKSEKDRAHH
jgi:elongation factor Ts